MFSDQPYVTYSTAARGTTINTGGWTRLNVTHECEATPHPGYGPGEGLGTDPGRAWAGRNDESCWKSFWPSPRAGHVAVLDTKRGGMWLHGGYRTHFPYLSTEGPGTYTYTYSFY